MTKLTTTDFSHIDLDELLKARRLVAATWNTEDVHSIRADLTDDQAWEVLQEFEKSHNCELGLTWSLLEYIANELYPIRMAINRKIKMISASVNPFYRQGGQASSSLQASIFAKLPAAPRTASPVPHLTSLYHFDGIGPYGSRRYPGNCGGRLIRDLLLYFRPRSVFDPMTGSGTCRDVCRELAIPCASFDLKSGFDATDPASYAQFSDSPPFDFIWVHPPYWRQKIYSGDAQDLSRAPSLDLFLQGYSAFISHCVRLLSPAGKLVILMGDYRDREHGFVPLTFHTKVIAFSVGLHQAGTDIIRFSHGASSSRKSYSSSFIPGLHDVCMVFEKNR